MNNLSKEECTACREGAPPVTGTEREELMASLPDWKIEEVEGVPHLTRTFKFDDYLPGLEFTRKVGETAEKADHHPAILTEWGKVKVSWWTHKIRNLHKNDFIMAARTDEAYQG